MVVMQTVIPLWRRAAANPETSLKMGANQRWPLEIGVAGRCVDKDLPNPYSRRTCGLATRKAVSSNLSGVGLNRIASAAESQQALQGPQSVTGKDNSVKVGQCQAFPVHSFNHKGSYGLS